LAELRDLDVQCREGVEIDLGTLISKISPRAIIAGVKVFCRRKLRIAILPRLPTQFVRWRRGLEPGDAKVPLLFRTCTNRQSGFFCSNEFFARVTSKRVLSRKTKVTGFSGTQVPSQENGAVTPWIASRKFSNVD
jgi:hypothetical protein